MTNPLVHAFYLGRATAEVLSERLEHQFTDLLSSVGRFDAEQRDSLRQFSQDVMERAESAQSTAPVGTSTPDGTDSKGSPSNRSSSPTDIQATLDNLRAEIAQLRSTLQRYRQL